MTLSFSMQWSLLLLWVLRYMITHHVIKSKYFYGRIWNLHSVASHLCSWDVTSNSPKLFILLACCSASRCFTSSGIHSAFKTWNLTSAFVFSLFTFWPPDDPKSDGEEDISSTLLQENMEIRHYDWDPWKRQLFWKSPGPEHLAYEKSNLSSGITRFLTMKGFSDDDIAWVIEYRTNVLDGSISDRPHWSAWRSNRSPRAFIANAFQWFLSMLMMIMMVMDNGA